MLKRENMKNNKKNNEQEQVTDVKGTIVGFVAPESDEKTQEQEIKEFKLKRQDEKQLQQLSEEEQRKKREEYQKEEERLEGVKAELIRSIKERIPVIESKFKLVPPTIKKGKAVEKIDNKTLQNIEEKEAIFSKTQNQDETERE